MNARIRLIEALRAAAENIESGSPYQWGHVGQCNVGHVVQHLAQMDDRQILQAFGRTLDQWREHAIVHFDAAVGDEPLATTEAQRDWCNVVSAPLEQVYQLFHQAGLHAADIGHIEFLSDERVLQRIPAPQRWKLRRNDRSSAALYLRTMASLLEQELV